jgi:hypothetical protein
MPLGYALLRETHASLKSEDTGSVTPPSGTPGDHFLRSHPHFPAGLAEVVDDALGPRPITIRAADVDSQRSSANVLVHTMYATRGYRTDASEAAARRNWSH